ncbi:MAG: hypothetical protein AB7W47_17595 [Calditrichaceae bacterium]
MKYWIKAIAILIFLIGCDDDPVKPDNNTPKQISGVVSDTNGNALSDVDIHYIYYIGMDAVFKNAGIAYTLSAQQDVTLIIYNMFGDEIARPLDVVSQPAGYHNYIFDASDYTNGIYSYKIESGELNQEGSFLVRDDQISNLILKNPLLRSASDGSFELSYSTLGIGKKFTMMINDAENQLIVADSIKIILFKPDYKISVSTVKVDTTITTKKTFTLHN